MVGKKGITPIIATILLIVMTIGIAAFVFLWMQGFMNNLQAQTQEQIEALRTPQFQIVYAYNNSSNITFVITNTGEVPIKLNSGDATIIVEAYSKIDGSSQGTYQKPGNTAGLYVGGTCGVVNPQKQISCTINSNTLGIKGGIDLNDYYYVLRILYKGVTATYTIR